MEANAKNLRLKAKMKLISMSRLCGEQLSKQSSPDSYKHTPLTAESEKSSQQSLDVCDSNNDKPVSTLSDEEKVNKILIEKSVEQMCSRELMLKLISSNMPFGIPLLSLIVAYNYSYNRTSPLDVSNLLSLMLSARQINIHTINGINRVFINSEKNVTHMNSFVENLLCDNNIDGVVCPGDRMQDMSIPLNATSGINNAIDVKVTFIDDPLNIWIQIKKDKSDTVLQKLSEDLQFYNRIDLEKWRVPQQFLCIGLPVVTCHLFGDKCWQRARVTEIRKFHVTVDFVDFGGTARPSKNFIFLMKRQFLTPPVQALRVSLFGVNHLIKKTNCWPVMLTDKLRCVLFAKNYIRCEFMQKICENYYCVHLFDRKNLFLDANVFVNDFFRDKTECSSDVLNDLNNYKSYKNNNARNNNHTAIRSTISVNMNLLDLPQQSSEASISANSVNHDQFLTKSVDCDKLIGAPLIQQKIHSFYGESSSKNSYENLINSKVNNTESSFSSTSGIRSLKPNIKITFNIDIARKTVSSINNY